MLRGVLVCTVDGYALLAVRDRKIVHFIHHLVLGFAVLVRANGSIADEHSAERTGASLRRVRVALESCIQ